MIQHEESHQFGDTSEEGEWEDDTDEGDEAWNERKKEKSQGTSENAKAAFPLVINLQEMVLKDPRNIIQDPLQRSRDTVTFSAMRLLDNRRRWEDEVALDDQEFSSKITEAKIQLRSLMIAKGTLLNDKELVDYGVRHLALYLHSLILYRAGLTGRQNRRKVSNGSF